jgi:predicted nucleic acid-binding protein
MQMVESNLSTSEAETVSQIAFQEGTTFYDAAYLALAERNGCRLLTDDRRLHSKVSERRHLIQLLEDYHSPDGIIR